MSIIQPQTGFVAFFDIMGYKQIILNNDIHRTAQIVSDTLINIPSSIIDNVSHVTQSAASSDLDYWQSTLSRIDWLIFSDSILISLPFDPQAEFKHMLQSYAVFAMVCSTLLNKSFTAGLPLRGGISVGEFFVEERCFAGKPIISALRAAQDLEMCGCILDEEGSNFISMLRKDVVKSGDQNMLNMLDQTTILYIPPTKEDTQERHRMINWVLLNIKGFPQFDGSIRDYVTSAFLRHNKIVLPSVLPKIDNTEMFVRHVLTNLELKPWSLNDINS